MITIDPVHVHTAGFTAVVEGNGGECQLVFIATTRQDGQTAYSINTVSVDDNVKLVRSGLVPTNDFPFLVAAVLNEWCGRQPRGRANIDLAWVQAQARIDVTARIVQHYLGT